MRHQPEPSAIPVEQGHEISRCVFNREAMDIAKVSSLLAGALEDTVLMHHGGYLFKANLAVPDFHLGMIPTILEGERGYHHTIRLKHDDRCTLIGSITAQREVSIIYKNPDPSDAERHKIQAIYSNLATLLLQANHGPELTLDWVTIHILEHAQLFSVVPRTLAKLAAATG